MTMITEIKQKKVRVGDVIRVSQKIQEEDRIRIQVFEGTVIAIKGRDTGKSFTVRKIAAGGIGVERIWPVNSPSIAKITVVKRGNPKRSKLYYLRKRVSKEAQSPITSQETGIQGEP